MHPNIRGNHPEVFCGKDVFKNFAEFTGKHLRQTLLFIWIIICYFKRFRRYFEHVFVSWKSNRTTIAVDRILEISSPANKYLMSVSNRTPERHWYKTGAATVSFL